MREARRLVFVLRMMKIPSAKHQTGALRRENFYSRVETQSMVNPIAEDFDSREMAEKEPISTSVLTPPSGENPIIGAYIHNLSSGRNPTAKGFNSCRMAEKESVCTFALMPLSQKISSAERTNTILQVGKIPAVEESCSRLCVGEIASTEHVDGWMYYDG